MRCTNHFATWHQRNAIIPGGQIKTEVKILNVIKKDVKSQLNSKDCFKDTSWIKFSIKIGVLALLVFAEEALHIYIYIKMYFIWEKGRNSFKFQMVHIQTHLAVLGIFLRCILRNLNHTKFNKRKTWIYAHITQKKYLQIHEVFKISFYKFSYFKIVA